MLRHGEQVMNHLTEEDLVLYRYEESPDPDAVARHLGTCADCRAHLATLDRLFAAMDAAVPEPGPAYEREVWARIQDRLAAEPPAPWSLRRWLGGASSRSIGHWVVPQVALAACVTLMLAGIVWFERYGHAPAALPGGIAKVTAPAASSPVGATPPPESRDTPQTAEQIRNRVLLAALGDHLQRVELMLTEFNNTDGHRGVIDLTDEQAWAEDLVNENRLYRRSAADAGSEDQIVAVLDDLERALLEVAHAPTETTPEQLDRLRMRIGTQDVLFKVRVVGAGMRDRQQMAAAVVNAPSVARPLSGS
jgi:hypothetical protein